MSAEEIELPSTRRKRFTEAEDNRLRTLVKHEGIKNWEEIASLMPGRSSRQCRDRYNNYLFKEILHKPWSPEEDRIIVEKYKIYGPHWVKISQFLEARSGNNVKNRWHKYLSKNYQNTVISQNSQPISSKPVLPPIALIKSDMMPCTSVVEQYITYPYINSVIVNYPIQTYQTYQQQEMCQSDIQVPEYLQLKTLLANPVNI